MAYEKMSATETRVDGPGNQTMLDKLRGNDDEIMRSKPLLVRYLSYYDSIGVVTRYDVDGNATQSVVGQTLIATYRIYIPNGITSLMVDLYANNTAAHANRGIRVIIGGVNLNFLNFGAGWAWRGEQAIAPGVTGWQDVTVYARSDAAGAWWGGIRGITIRPNV